VAEEVLLEVLSLEMEQPSLLHLVMVVVKPRDSQEVKEWASVKDKEVDMKIKIK